MKDIVNSSKHLYSIVLYGTKQKGQASQANHITTLQSLSCPNADQIKELINIIHGTLSLLYFKLDFLNNFNFFLNIFLFVLDIDGFEIKHGHSNDYSLAEALWHCMKIISNWLVNLSNFLNIV